MLHLTNLNLNYIASTWSLVTCRVTHVGDRTDQWQ